MKRLRLLLVGVAFGFAPHAINAPARRLCIRASDNAPSPSPFSSSPFAQSSSSTLTPIFIGRTVVFAALMSVLLPPTFAVAAARAVFQRVTKGTPDQILPTGETGALGPGQDGYGGQMLFDRPIDPARLRAALEGLAAEAGLAPASARLDVEAAAPRAVVGPAFDWDAYVDGPNGPGTGWLEKASDPTRALWLRLFNGARPGDTTVIQYHLPAAAWDGTSCFNFMKELLHRYCGGAPNRVFRGAELALSAEAAARVRAGPDAAGGGLAARLLPPFAAFLLFRLPRACALNLASAVWALACSAPPPFGGSGVALHAVCLNLDVATSARLAAGLKRRGAAPFAGLVFAAVSAHREVLGALPRGVVQQASLQTRAYAPAVAERNLVGDWLVGPFERVRARPGGAYTLADAQLGYERLLADLESLGGSVGRALEAKAYGLLNGGAAAFEAPPTYGDDFTIFSSIFFNNYGRREIHPDAGCVGWNWGAPFKLGCNCIFINGRTCICFASCVLNREILRAIRDHAQETLMELAGEP